MKCQATKPDGSPCGSPERFVDSETGYCHAHGPGASERLSEAGRKGAEIANKGRSPDGLDPEELPPLETHAEAKLWLERIGRAVATGRLSDRQGQAVIRAVSEWVKAHEGELTAKVVDDLESEVERLQSELSGTPRLERAK